MAEIFSIASGISTPLALAGLLAAAFFFILRQILKKDLFPKLTRQLSSEILKKIIDRLFVLALVALILGTASYCLRFIDANGNSGGKERAAVEKAITQMLVDHETKADVICTALGTIDNSEWETYSHYLKSTVQSYVNPEVAERNLLTEAFISRISEASYAWARSIVDQIQSESKLYLIESKEDAKRKLLKLDRLYQAFTEVVLFEIGKNDQVHPSRLHPRIVVVRGDPRNTPYCRETKFNAPTKQILGR